MFSSGSESLDHPVQNPQFSNCRLEQFPDVAEPCSSEPAGAETEAETPRSSALMNAAMYFTSVDGVDPANARQLCSATPKT